MEGTIVRRLEAGDIDAAIALTDLEAWGYTRADFQRLLALSPTGCFVADLGRRIVGVLTTTAYGALAFLGAVIVAPELRGKGVGKQMMDAALQHLQDAGVRSVRLYAYLNAVPFYEKLGFHAEYEVVRWHGPASAQPARGVRRLRRNDFIPLVQLDARYFGAARGSVLSRLADEFPETFLVAEKGGRLRGFIVGNPGDGSCEIGPWVVEPDAGSTARDLYRSVVVAAGASNIALSGPAPNKALVEFVRESRFNEAFRALRMWFGTDDYPGEDGAIWALGGLEKG